MYIIYQFNLINTHTYQNYHEIMAAPKYSINPDFPWAPPTSMDRDSRSVDAVDDQFCKKTLTPVVSPLCRKDIRASKGHVYLCI